MYVCTAGRLGCLIMPSTSIPVCTDDPKRLMGTHMLYECASVSNIYDICMATGSENCIYISRARLNPGHLSKVMISPDALRMRCRRLCERKVSGKCHVTPEIREDYINGGESREIVELALLDAIAKYGVQRKVYKKVKA